MKIANLTGTPLITRPPDQEPSQIPPRIAIVYMKESLDFSMCFFSVLFVFLFLLFNRQNVHKKINFTHLAIIESPFKYGQVTTTASPLLLLFSLCSEKTVFNMVLPLYWIRNFSMTFKVLKDSMIYPGRIFKLTKVLPFSGLSASLPISTQMIPSRSGTSTTLTSSLHIMRTWQIAF